jgi:hypothetical protein
MHSVDRHSEGPLTFLKHLASTFETDSNNVPTADASRSTYYVGDMKRSFFIKGNFNQTEICDE